MDIRECFIPRPGRVFAIGDYSMLELRTLAQVCKALLGYSRLAEVLNSGRDVHTDVGSQLIGITYEEAARRIDIEEAVAVDARQLAKIANFGLPGGMQGESFVLFARKSGVILADTPEKCLAKAEWLSEQWFKAWPEVTEYFKLIKKTLKRTNGVLEQLYTKRLRGGLYFTNGANTMFQGLGADAAHRAGWLITEACYVRRDNVLFGSRVVNFPHDEFVVEIPEDDLMHERAMMLGRLMVLGANEFLPDVPAEVKPFVARRWMKKAKAVYNDQGRLIPWDPAVHMKRAA